MKSLTPLANKTVIVTAGHRGGGATVSRRFAAAGANIAIIAPRTTENNSRVNEVSNQIISVGGKAITVEVDISNVDEIESAISKIATQFGGIDILINNFSIFNFHSVLETTPEEFSTVISNTFTTFFFSKACIPYLKNSNNPHVINISPPIDMKSAKEACGHHLLFSISKYGMSFCTIGMAEEFKHLGIAFNSLWQERPVSTATLKENFVDDVLRGSYKPEIYAEAAYLISLKPAKNFTGNFCIDEKILLEHGVDVRQFAVDPSATPVKDIFLPGADYNILRPMLKKKS